MVIPGFGGHIGHADGFGIAKVEGRSPEITVENSGDHITARVVCEQVTYGRVAPRKRGQRSRLVSL